jgi:hypothetical protein
MRSDRLFAGPDFHSVLEHEKARLVQAYEQLPDAEALDDEVQKNLRQNFCWTFLCCDRRASIG